MSEKLTEGSLYVYTQNRIATVAFGHPAANSFPSALLGRLSHTLLDLGKNPEVSVILIKSEGEKTFCAGASFDELKAVRNEAKGRDFFSGFAQLLNALREIAGAQNLMRWCRHFGCLRLRFGIGSGFCKTFGIKHRHWSLCDCSRFRTKNRYFGAI